MKSLKEKQLNFVESKTEDEFRAWSSRRTRGHARAWRHEGRQGEGKGRTKEGWTPPSLGEHTSKDIFTSAITSVPVALSFLWIL